VYAFGIESLFVSHFEQGQQDVAAYFGSPWPPGNPEAIAMTGYFNVKATFDLPQVFIKLTAEIGKAVIISRLEDYVPRNLDSIQCLYLKPLRTMPPARKTGVVPSLAICTARNLFGQ